MTIIEKIKAEIERRKAECIARSKSYKREDEVAEHYYYGKAFALGELLSFLSTLEEPVCRYGDIPSYGRCAVCSAACSARMEEKSEKPNNHGEGILLLHLGNENWNVRLSDGSEIVLNEKHFKIL